MGSVHIQPQRRRHLINYMRVVDAPTFALVSQVRASLSLYVHRPHLLYPCRYPFEQLQTSCGGRAFRSAEQDKLH